MMPDTLPSLFKGQLLHIGFLCVALPVICIYADPGSGTWLGVTVCSWLCLALLAPVVHQTYVWLCWRLELRNQSISKRWGLEKGFRIYVTIFFLLFGSRFLTLLLLALADRDSLPMSPDLRVALGIPLLFVVGYSGYSIKRYFGFRRAAGIDHFDPAYASRPLVRQGVFKWSKNAMYVFALQGTWLFGILAASKLAMIAACFQSVYIWIHYFGIEKPDMATIYRR